MTDTALKIREQVVGTELSAVTFVRDYVQLNFDGPGFTVLTPITVSSSDTSCVSGDEQFRNRLCDQIRKRFADVLIKEHELLLISFDDGSSIALSLRDNDYPGPEAVIFNGSDDFWVVF